MPTDEVRPWFEPVTAAERTLLRSATGPVLDVGCGPGRLVRALSEMGVPVLGIDIAAGHEVLGFVHPRLRPRIRAHCIFDHVPYEGVWKTVILLDGNVGIGGDPAALLRRVHEVAARDALALVELERPGALHTKRRVRIESGPHAGPWFDIRGVATDEIDRLAETGGWQVERRVTLDARNFAWLRA